MRVCRPDMPTSGEHEEIERLRYQRRVLCQLRSVLGTSGGELALLRRGVRSGPRLGDAFGGARFEDVHLARPPRAWGLVERGQRDEPDGRGGEPHHEEQEREDGTGRSLERSFATGTPRSAYAYLAADTVEDSARRGVDTRPVWVRRMPAVSMQRPGRARPRRQPDSPIRRTSLRATLFDKCLQRGIPTDVGVRERTSESGQATAEYVMLMAAIAIGLIAASFPGRRRRRTLRIVVRALQQAPFTPPSRPTSVWPTSLADCEDGGWRNYPQFARRG